ncbi:MAG: DUF1465 family protein [Alphaproteobacteria bacterium]|nr:DUF1465 family protein [Alphaproteobacteria bacterium]
MSEFRSVQNGLAADRVTVSFGERFEASGQFDAVFREGMGLVEEVAAYLDGLGRRESKALKPPLSVLYATESMRLTTRLLDLASWLLIRRALKEGEIDADEAKRKRQRVKLKALGRPGHIKRFEELPASLQDLIERSFALHDRIVKLDRAVTSENSSGADGLDELPISNPVAAQLNMLRQAFGN